MYEIQALFIIPRQCIQCRGYLGNLEARSICCYRCMSQGHTRQKCALCFDCGDLCFHRGQPGHQAASCNVTPHCPVCAVAKFPADHQVGGKSCKPAAPRRKRAATSNLTAARVAVGREKYGYSLIRDHARSHRILQMNLNHSTGAQDLLLQTMVE